MHGLIHNIHCNIMFFSISIFIRILYWNMSFMSCTIKYNIVLVKAISERWPLFGDGKCPRLVELFSRHLLIGFHTKFQFVVSLFRVCVVLNVRKLAEKSFFTYLICIFFVIIFFMFWSNVRYISIFFKYLSENLHTNESAFENVHNKNSPRVRILTH